MKEYIVEVILPPLVGVIIGLIIVAIFVAMLRYKDDYCPKVFGEGWSRAADYSPLCADGKGNIKAIKENQ